VTNNTNKTEAEAKVEAAALIVSEWGSNVEAIKSKIADAKQKVADMREKRREHALDAALDQAPANKALAAAHSDQAAAEKLADDLAYALEQAKARLASAEVVHGVACRQVALKRACEVIARRVAAASRFDAAAREMEAALTEYNCIWSELAGVDFDGANGMGMSVMEARRGEKRIPGALPPSLRKALSIGGATGSLENSERLVWKGLA
jgi:hypothetical protein